MHVLRQFSGHFHHKSVPNVGILFKNKIVFQITTWRRKEEEKEEEEKEKDEVLYCATLTFFCFCGALFNHKLTPKILPFNKIAVSLLCKNTCTAVHSGSVKGAVRIELLIIV